MNRTIRNLVIAAPLVLAGITVAPGAAMADGFDIGIPEPQPQPPKDIAIPDPPKPPKGPQDLADAPKPQAPKPQPNGGDTGTDAPAAGDVKDADTKKEAKVVSAKGSPDSIDRDENLFVAGPAEVQLGDDTDNGGMDLSWLLVGGGVVTASGIAFAARKRTNA
jgi:hypothetical protein